MAESPSSVASAGDVNGDGFGDVLVGDPRWEDTFPTQADEGAAFVFLGSASGVAPGNPGNAAATLQSNTQFAQMGFAVSGAGDIDADGYGDVIVGTPNTLGVGSACVQYGGASGIASATAATCTTRLTQSFSGSFLGWDVAGIGDLDGDGYADVAVGAPGYAAVVSGEGAAFVWRGRATRIPSGNESTASDSIIGQISSSAFGSSVAGAGDVNGDAYADLIVGADAYNYSGAAFVFAGGPFGLGTNLTPENVAATSSPGDRHRSDQRCSARSWRGRRRERRRLRRFRVGAPSQTTLTCPSATAASTRCTSAAARRCARRIRSRRSSSSRPRVRSRLRSASATTSRRRAT
jgi:hypothetical protein